MQSHSANEQRIVAADMSRALRKLSEQLGPDAVLLSSRKLPNGVEIIALPAGAKPSSKDFSAMHSDRRSGDRRAKERRSDADIAALVNANANDSDNDKDKANVNVMGNAVSMDSKASVHSAASRLAQSIGELKTPFSDASAFETLQQELQQVKKMLEDKMSAPVTAQAIMPNPVQYILINRILTMGLPLEIARALTDDLDIHHDVHAQADDQAAIDRAWQLCLTRIEAVLPVAKDDIVAAGGVVAFVGPSGAGKSAAISKLATRWLLEHSAKDIAIISHDAGSESGAGRMSRFSSMTGIPIFYVDKDHSLIERIAQCAKRRLVLIDTLSLSPENPAAEQQLATLSTLSRVKTLTVLPATGDRRWITRAIHQYQQPNSVGCLLTHMDQVESIGELVAVLLTEQTPVHYLSDGGLLPKYIQTPQRGSLMAKLFKANVADGEADYIAVPTVNLHAEDASALATG
ncbi:hypothetical protein N9F42_03740 [Pseudomonadales bacterium]|nr:hypothetical protein [Pseudomonadales bacterium]